MTLLADGSYHLAVGSTEFGNGSAPRTARSPPPCSATRADRVAIVHADTDRTPYDTGTFASTGTVVAGKAVALAAEALRDSILEFASRTPARPPTAASRTRPSICGERRIPLADLHAAGDAGGHRFECAQGLPLAAHVAFNVHGFRLAVHRVTGEIGILQSVHAADIGRLINPMQCRGQIEGAIAMGIGWALYEKMVFDESGAIVNPQFRNYRIPAFADMPRTEIYFADTHDTIGPLGAKAQGECPINPVAPALANAWPTPPASASPICRCRPSGSSTGSAAVTRPFRHRP